MRNRLVAVGLVGLGVVLGALGLWALLYWVAMRP